MKICLIGPADNYHIVKWYNWFKNAGDDVSVITFSEKHPSIVENIYCISTNTEVSSSDISKVRYLFHGIKIKDIVDKINPDIVSVHYATSYGTAVALSGIRNYVLSVWGSDIYDFPKKSIFHKLMLKYSLWKATHIFSTSQAMADETHKYTDKRIDITPFGVDVELFNPIKRTRLENDGKFVVGTVKTLSDKYGIRYLIEAVAKIKNERPDIPIELRIAGKGSQEKEYRKLAQEIKISQITKWLGFISQEEAAKEWANMDVAIVPSVLESESFGVSAVEAQASSTPVIISDIPGLMEATKPGVTSIVVPRRNSNELANAIVELYDNRKKYRELGEEGRKFVINTYEINMCFERIRDIFKSYFM